MSKILKSQEFTEECSVHVVREGETLSSISKQYGIPIHPIVTLNKSIVDHELVYEGQVLKIPLSKRYAEKYLFMAFMSDGEEEITQKV